MSDSDTEDRMTATEFEAELAALLNRALDSGVDVRGGWDIDVDEEFDLGVEITAIERFE